MNFSQQSGTLGGHFLFLLYVTGRPETSGSVGLVQLAPPTLRTLFVFPSGLRCDVFLGVFASDPRGAHPGA